eukprot:360719-Chlamydomonas_euryale.AAC.20
MRASLGDITAPSPPASAIAPYKWFNTSINSIRVGYLTQTSVDGEGVVEGYVGPLRRRSVPAAVPYRTVPPHSWDGQGGRYGRYHVALPLGSEQVLQSAKYFAPLGHVQFEAGCEQLRRQPPVITNSLPGNGFL